MCTRTASCCPGVLTRQPTSQRLCRAPASAARRYRRSVPRMQRIWWLYQEGKCLPSSIRPRPLREVHSVAGARGANACVRVAAACNAILVHDGVANRTKVRTAYSLTPQRLLRHASYCHYGQETSLAGSQFFSSGKSDVLRCISSAREHTYCPTCLEPVPASVSGVTHNA